MILFIFVHLFKKIEELNNFLVLLSMQSYKLVTKETTALVISILNDWYYKNDLVKPRFFKIGNNR